jgi:hypothetical protein
VICSISVTTASAKSTMMRPFSPMAESPTPAKTEKTRSCSTLFCAMASSALVGKISMMKWRKVSWLVARSPSPWPGSAPDRRRAGTD